MLIQSADILWSSLPVKDRTEQNKHMKSLMLTKAQFIKKYSKKKKKSDITN